MVSYLIFCHKNGESSEGHSLVGKTEGFAQIPYFLKEIFLDETPSFDGSVIINGQEIVGDGKKGSILLINGANVDCFSKYAGPSPANAVGIAQKISSYKETHAIRLEQELLLQKVLLAVFQELQAGSPFVYINLESCPEAALLLDALKFVFPSSPILFSLPPYLDFALPELGASHEDNPDEQDQETPSLNDATLSFFKELVGIQKADPANIPVAAKGKAAPAEGKIGPSQPNSEKPMEKNGSDEMKKAKKSATSQPKKRKAITPEKRKDALWNGGFSLLFFALSSICPYLFFWFSESGNPIYFALYLILQVFFLAMTTLPISYISSDHEYFSKGCLFAICSIAPFLAIVSSIALYFIARSCGWSGYPVYVFCGVSLGYPLLYPPLLFFYRKLDERSKKKGKKKRSD